MEKPRYNSLLGFGTWELAGRESWGPEGLKKAWIHDYAAGLAAQLGPMPVLAGIRFRLSLNETIGVLGHGKDYWSEATGRIPLNHPGNSAFRWHILDFFPLEASGLIVLDWLYDPATKSVANVLRAVDSSGESKWEHRYPVNELTSHYLGKRSRLVDLSGVGGQVFLTQYNEEGRLEFLRIETETGDLHPDVTVPVESRRAFRDRTAHVYCVEHKQNAEVRKHVMKLSPDTGKVHYKSGNKYTYGILSTPLGVDAEGNCYGASIFEACSLSPESETRWHFRAEGMVPNGSELLLSARNWEEPTRIQVWRAAESEAAKLLFDVQLPVTPGLTIRNWRLIAAEGEELVFYGSNPFNRDRLVRLNRKGELIGIEEDAGSASNMAWRLQTAESWQMNESGSIFLPVVGPEGWRILRID